jgi:hypothetical protein
MKRISHFVDRHVFIRMPKLAWVGLALLVVAVAAPLRAGTVSGSSQNAITGNAGNPGVLPPQTRAYGKTYGEWEAAWWQWVFSFPLSQHPLLDAADCSAGQSGPVWFLGGTFAAITLEDGTVLGQAERSCTLPPGKALLFPIINNEWDNLGCPEPGNLTPDELQALATWAQNHTTSLSCSIDGVAIQNLERYRVVAPIFSYTLPAEPNLIDQLYGCHFQGEVSPAAADGVFVMVAPLSTGQHTIHFGGELVFTAEEDGFDFVFQEDITYHLTVQ